MDLSVVICTHNRADSLQRTLAALAALQASRPWEAVLVDNASTDSTRQVSEAAATGFPVPLRYVYEPEPGKYGALNTGIRHARGRIIAATDDDAQPGPGWLREIAAGFEQLPCDFVGGPVRPLWLGQRPSWLPERSSVHWKVLALQDYGSYPREYGVGIGWPLGVNVAYKREVFDRVGWFDNRLGRIAGTLRNQSQREWHLRARSVGVRGFYVPDMLVHHVVLAERLTKDYFRRWFYWHGRSRAILSHHTGLDVEEPETAAAGRRRSAARGLFAKAFRSTISCLHRRVRRQDAEAFEYELWLWFLAGVVRESWALRSTGRCALRTPEGTCESGARRP